MNFKTELVFKNKQIWREKIKLVFVKQIFDEYF